jgi:1,2-diacylglycerol 3-beta-galactosyltransferase
MADRLGVLVLMSDTGGGHRSVALAVQRALERQAPGAVTTRIVDLFAPPRPALTDRLTRLYVPSVQYAPALYGFLFHLLNHPAAYRSVTAWTRPTLLPRMQRLLQVERPDVVVTTHPLCNWVALEAMAALGLAVPVLAVVTELVTVHRSWVEPAIARYATATSAASAAVLRLGVPPERLTQTGLPIDERFGRVEVAPEEIRERLGLERQRFTVLAVGGGDGLGLRPVVQAIDGSDLDAQLIVACGRNWRLAARLRQAPPRMLTAILGFSSAMPELMHAADVILTKGGPQSIAEALASGRGVVVTSTVPGQEEGNAELVEALGCGVDGRSLPRAIEAVRRLAADAEHRRSMAARARNLARLEAAGAVARVVRELGNRAGVVARVRP